ncbi:MAG: inositol 2-dehydrogenase [Clostridiaceae bacterium]|nr:inositol 2-dehydrogenase [Clostridiaceae bacterium]
MKQLNIGVIGLGRIGRLHVENLQNLVPEANVIAGAEVYIDNVREWAEERKLPNLYQDYNEVLANPEVDAVVIATSTDTHAEVAIAAAKAGKQIFCEKPIDSNIDRIKEVLAEVDKAGVLFQTGFNRRFDHNFKRVHDIVESGEIGDPHIIRVTSRDPAPPPVEYVKVSGGIFFDMMIHDFDMVRYLSQSEALEVSAHGAVLIDPAIGEAGDIDTAVVTLKMANGALAVIDNSRQAVYGYDQRVEVFGSAGIAKADNDRPSTVEVSTDQSVNLDKIPYFFLDRYTGAFVDQFKYFIQACHGETKLMVDGIDGLRAVEIAQAATTSLKEGRAVKL